MLYTLSYALYAFICFHTLSYTFKCLLNAFECFYMLLKAKVSQEQQEEEEMLHLCLTGFYLWKPVKTGI